MKIKLFAALVICLMQSGESIRLADPTIYYYNNKYYLTGTGDGFPCYTSADLANWKPQRDLLQKGAAYGAGKFWAPQLFQYRDSFRLAYAADEHIAIAGATSIDGPYTQRQIAPLDSFVKQIDPFVFQDPSGTVYLYYVEVARGGNRIYVRELDKNLRPVSTEHQLCIEADQAWEHDGYSNWRVTEGPTVFRHQGKYYMLYSANHFKSQNYAVGLAWSDSPRGPWKKFEGNPILSKNNLPAVGTGHGDLFTGADGKLHYVMHVHNSGDQAVPRRTAMVSLEWTKVNGTPVLQYVPGSFQLLQTAN